MENFYLFTEEGISYSPDQMKKQMRRLRLKRLCSDSCNRGQGVKKKKDGWMDMKKINLTLVGTELSQATFTMPSATPVLVTTFGEKSM